MLFDGTLDRGFQHLKKSRDCSLAVAGESVNCQRLERDRIIKSGFSDEYSDLIGLGCQPYQLCISECDLSVFNPSL